MLSAEQGHLYIYIHIYENVYRKASVAKTASFYNCPMFGFVVTSLNDSSFLGQCSVLSELSVITFDGNNIALCNMASYILVKLPGEIIVAHIEKCPANQVRFLHFCNNCNNFLNFRLIGINTAELYHLKLSDKSHSP